MYVILAALQVKPGYKEEFIEAMLGDAKGSFNNEPGCLRFDLIQDAGDENRVWLYEVYKDEAAFQYHTKQPHFTDLVERLKVWRDEAPQGAARGSYNIWPPDDLWK